MDCSYPNIMLRDGQRDLVSTYGRLLTQARTISERMMTFADRLEREGVGRQVNELGELQGLGLELDRLCAVFAEKQRKVKELEFLCHGTVPVRR